MLPFLHDEYTRQQQLTGLNVDQIGRDRSKT